MQFIINQPPSLISSRLCSAGAIDDLISAASQIHTVPHEFETTPALQMPPTQIQRPMSELPSGHPTPAPLSAPALAKQATPIASRDGQDSIQFQPSPGREPSITEGGAVSSGEIARLEEEERRIDEAIKESERLVESRKQRESVHAKLKVTKGGRVNG